MDDKEELRWCRKSIRLMLRGLSPRAILKQIPRSRAWLYKWRQRFERFRRWRPHIKKSTMS